MAAGDDMTMRAIFATGGPRRIVVSLVAAMLAACGGSGGGDGEAPPPDSGAPPPAVTKAQLEAASRLSAQATFGMPWAAFEPMARQAGCDLQDPRQRPHPASARRQ